MFDYQFIQKQENIFLVIPQIVSKIEKEKLEKELNFFSVCVDKQYMYFLFSRDSQQPICEDKKLKNSVCISANIIQEKIHGKYNKQQQIFNRIRQTSVVLQEYVKKQNICLADLEIVKCISNDRELNLNLTFKNQREKFQFCRDFGLSGNINFLILKGVLLQLIESKQKRTGFNIEKFKKMSNYQSVCDQLKKELNDQILNCQINVFYDQNHKKIKVTSDYPDQIAQALKIVCQKKFLTFKPLEEKFYRLKLYQNYCGKDKILLKQLIKNFNENDEVQFLSQKCLKMKFRNNQLQNRFQFVDISNNQVEGLNQLFIFNNNINNNENDIGLYNQYQISDEDYEEDDDQNEQLIQNNNQENDNGLFNQYQIANNYYIFNESQGSAQNDSQQDHLEQHETMEIHTQIIEISSIIEQSQLQNNSLCNID
ncbi:hypothetical protein PPERSA_07686 [Pseudocohnilembus persalinus]|uniref:Uncharacterized protein n=1 Tax=Pseudocohnilembus persalinus TaxID=266149 RepID=A0A0V0QIJ2_PSEPJ|nr:hypothetical protein PPERSA_07686 [Pseudocohnilembus persalinus]|eukprot:KRX02041.1 hypothetical protein PPERSA_07686 [Pseudocohnilembus persalinus]